MHMSLFFLCNKTFDDAINAHLKAQKVQETTN